MVTQLFHPFQRLTGQLSTNDVLFFSSHFFCFCFVFVFSDIINQAELETLQSCLSVLEDSLQRLKEIEQ